MVWLPMWRAVVSHLSLLFPLVGWEAVPTVLWIGSEWQGWCWLSAAGFESTASAADASVATKSSNKPCHRVALGCQNWTKQESEDNMDDPLEDLWQCPPASISPVLIKRWEFRVVLEELLGCHHHLKALLSWGRRCIYVGLIPFAACFPGNISPDFFLALTQRQQNWRQTLQLLQLLKRKVKVGCRGLLKKPRL